MAVPTRDHVVALLEGGHSFETAGRELGIAPGLVFMIATGVPADGSDTPSRAPLREARHVPPSTQHLSEPPAFNPTRKDGVLEWVRERAARDLSRGPAGP